MADLQLITTFSSLMVKSDKDSGTLDRTACLSPPTITMEQRNNLSNHSPYLSKDGAALIRVKPGTMIFNITAKQLQLFTNEEVWINVVNAPGGDVHYANGFFSGGVNAEGDITALGNLAVGKLAIVDSLRITDSIEGSVIIDTNLTVRGEAQILAHLTVEGDCTITGQLRADNVNFNKAVNFPGGATIEQLLDINGNIEVANNAIIDKNLTVTGTTSLNTANITGVTTLSNILNSNSAVNFTGITNTNNLIVNGTTALKGSATIENTSNFGGIATFSKAIVAQDTLTVTGNTALSTATSSGNVTIGKNLAVTGISTFTGEVGATNLNIGGTSTTVGNTTLSTVTVSKDATFNQKVISTGDISTASNLVIGQNSTFNGNINVLGDAKFVTLNASGNTTVNGQMHAIGVGTFDSSVNVGTNLTVSGNSNLTNLAVSNTASFTKGITTSTDSTLSGTTTINKLAVGTTASFADSVTANSLNVTSNQTVGGTLSVTGLATLASAKIASLNLTGDLTTGGNATIAGTLGVTGLTTLSQVVSTGTLTADGEAVFNDNVTVNKNISIIGNNTTTGTLNVTGVGTMNSDLGVKGAINVTGVANLKDSLTASALNVTNNSVLNGKLTVVGTTSVVNVISSGTLSVTGATNLTGTLTTNDIAVNGISNYYNNIIASKNGGTVKLLPDVIPLLNFQPQSSSFTTSLTAGVTASDITFTLPVTGGISGQILTTSGGYNPTMSWITQSGGGNVTGNASTTTNALALWGNSSGSSLNSTDFVVDANGNLGLNSKKITALADPTLAQDASTKKYVDGKTITLTGAVTGSGVLGSIDTSLTNIDTSQISNFNTTVTGYRLDQFAIPTTHINLNSKKITALADPTLAQDASTKNYVDLHVDLHAGFSNQQIFKTAGTFTWVVPTGKTSAELTLIGGGAGGGGGVTNSVSGGGSGAGTVIDILSLTPGETITIIIGALGAGGTAGNNGANGSPSYVKRGTTTLLTANGGLGGKIYPGGNSPTCVGVLGSTAIGFTANADIIIGGMGGPPNNATSSTANNTFSISGYGGGTIRGSGASPVVKPYTGTPFAGSQLAGVSAQTGTYGCSGSGAYTDLDNGVAVSGGDGTVGFCKIKY